ncbi:MAG: acyl esterase [Campylobacterota bacterium]|nr:acyl esterase [Campylobacterota bacterium]
MSKIVEIDSIQNSLLFSICTLVTDMSEYKSMVESCNSAGFSDENSEFIYIDNTKSNKYDGYSGVREFLNRAKGQYIIIVHQDVLFEFDTKDTLLKCIDEVTKKDDSWALLGNAGYSGLTKKAMRISDPYGKDVAIGSLPQQVLSLDENFIVVRSSANLAISNDINGFHFYGTDLCLLASMIGRSAYVIDFHVFHKSAGSCGSNFYEVKERFMQSYTKKKAALFVRTPCTNMFLSASKILNRCMNFKLIFSIKKRLEF